MGRLIGIETDTGNKRTLNEDAVGYYENEDLGIFIVADGMGGHNAGEIASKIAVETVIKYIKEHHSVYTMEQVIDAAISEANKEIYKYALLDESCSGMGTTITVAFVKNNELVIGNVGDSRCYIISKGEFKKITKDHSLVQELVDNGTITEEEARTHPNKNVITRAVGTKAMVKGDCYTLALSSIDKVIICSDGLTNEVSEEEIIKVIENNEINSCLELVRLSKHKGGRDNISVIIFKGECTDDWNHIG
jgi:serine/threonine protein phosphatase PrpC